MRVVAAEHASKSGRIDYLGLGQSKPYWISTNDGGRIPAADNEAELIMI
jgi:hypothetical protein